MTAGRSEWPGFYYDGRTAERQPVRLTLDASGLRFVRPDGTWIVWPFDTVRQTQGAFSSEQVRIEYGVEPVEVILVSEPGFAFEMRRASPEARRTIRRQWHAWEVFGWSFAAFVAAVGLYVWGAPIAAEWAASKVPPSWEASMGRNVTDRMLAGARVCTDSAAIVPLETVMDRLTSATRSPYNFKLTVVRDTTVNAFAAPGGFIVVNSGLLTAAETPEQFAGVLAHEIQHVTQRHSTRAIFREVPLRLAISAVTGGGVETAAGVVASIGALRYRRADELEADREGMSLLRKAQVDPFGSVEFMRKLEVRGEDAPGFVSYLSSHPRTAQRVAELRSVAQQGRYETQPLMDSLTWQRVRLGCN